MTSGTAAAWGENERLSALQPDTVAIGPTFVIEGDTIQTYQVKPRQLNLWQRIGAYFDHTKPERIDGKPEFSFIGGPHYSSDVKLGLAVMVSASYRSKAYDPATPNSNAAVFADGSISGFYNFGLVGTHIFPKDKIRVTYKVDFESFPTKFWGIGWQNAHISDNETEYTDRQFKVDLDWVWKIRKGIYLGPTFVFQNIQAKHIDNDIIPGDPATVISRSYLWEGQKLHTQSLGIGAMVSFDTRDNLTAPTRGHYITLRQMFLPRFIGNDYAFSYTHFWASGYKTVWKGGVLAGLLQIKYEYGNPPWGMMAYFGGSRYLRGYYLGRYRDKLATEATVELRQHIYKRFGMVGWVGVGSVSPDFKTIRFRELLPSGGLGFRLAIRRNTNIRLDVGVGRHSKNFCFHMNEAF